MRELEPRRDVPVVVEGRDDDLVALAQGSRERPREQEVERGHARAERDLLGRAAEEGGRALARALDELVGAPARLVGRADVGVGLPEVAGDRVDHLVRALRAAGAVEEREGPIERAEARADRTDVEGRRAHATCSPLTVQW